MQNIKRRAGQHPDETVIEYLRRAVHNLGYEPESLLDDLPSIDAVLDFFDLWSAYDTDLWTGVLECIAEGDDPKAARDFIAKYELPDSWTEAVDDAVAACNEEVES